MGGEPAVASGAEGEGGDPRVVLELLKDAAPTLSRIAVLRNESEPDDAARRQIEAAARTLKLEVKEFLVGHAKDLAPTFAAMGQARVVINLKTAKALGLTIPQTLLQRADQIIE